MAVRTLSISAATAPGSGVLLGEARTAHLLAVAGVLPLGMNRLHLDVELVDEVEGELAHVPARAFAEQRAREQRLGDLLAGARHRDGDPQRAPDALVLADQDVEDDAVDGVVRAVPGDHPHLGLLLPEAIHPALALLVAGGVPGEVVVQDGIEVLLEVDAFGETVGAHEHEPAAPGPRISGQPGDALLALGVRKPAGDRLHPNVLRERGAQVPGDVLRGVDEAAEDDGVEAAPEERPDLAHRALKLPVVRGIQRLSAARELQQPAARRFGAPFRLRAGAEVERHRIVVVTLIEDGAASHLVHVLAFGRVDGGPAAQRRGGGGGTRRDAAQQRERRPILFRRPFAPGACVPPRSSLVFPPFR